ncbi:MAG: transposase [Bacteroidetes bacterium]|nr:transposase [Bacteroidota bacterium]
MQINMIGRNAYPTEMEFGTLKIHSRHLPHWEAEGAIYFVTFRAKNKILDVEEQKIVLDHVVKGNEIFYTLIAIIVMPDHVHILLFPLPSYTLRRIMKGIKGVAARKINNLKGMNGTVWQDESFDRIIRDEKELKVKLFYMLNNPVKQGLTDDPWNYHGWWFNQKIIVW